MPFVGDADEIDQRQRVAVTRVNRLKALICVVLLALWILTMVLLLAVSRVIKRLTGEWLIMRFHAGVARLFNLEIVTHGTPCVDRPTLYVCNHSSYLDVFVLGSVLPGSFIAKSEVANWPLFGSLAKLQNTLFFERNDRRAADQISIMRSHLLRKSNLILFPEGTSTPGDRVERFRSSLFQAAREEQINIQPVTVAYSHYRGVPMTQAERDRYAWYLPMTFGPHFLSGLGLGRARVQIIFHDPVKLSAFADRKICAEFCETSVRSGLESALGLQ
jgi:1-acyl-sn-glycerol-3-phosphate acyltransferase